ncbi:MAG: aspartate--tRNA(Asn) ligase [bacterium]|nr:aspartate--tRNA(Asn) ligase [bacterium]
MRTYIKDLKDKIGEEVTINGWVNVRRDQGKLIFFDFRDSTGFVQGVILPNSKEAHEVGEKLRAEWVVEVRGKVNKRPEKNVQADKLNGDLELEILGIEILSPAHELPFELGAEVNLDTYLDHLPFTLRSQKAKDIFTVQATLIEAYRQSLRDQGFTEFQAPALVGGDAEGGSAVFKVDYLYDKTAYLATSPQFYKQIMVGAFERSFTTAKIFRAEKSATTRHLSELTQMDFEMGFVRDHYDVMAVLETTIRDTVKKVTQTHPDIFKRFGTPFPVVGVKFPVFTLTKAQEIIEREFGGKAVGELDLEPEHERQICEYALREHGSDFVFITAFPTKKRAFYTYEDPKEAPFSRGFDLLFRGLEINSGSQRIHNYDDLISKIKERGLDPDKFSFYLQAFKYGMPPHGGSSTGLERITARMLNLPNVKQASAFPRDIGRIDQLLA